jgi:hypothetical protein
MGSPICQQWNFEIETTFIRAAIALNLPLVAALLDATP